MDPSVSTPVPESHEDASRASERSPLLRRTDSLNESAAGSLKGPEVPTSVKRRVVVLIYLAAFALMFGENIQLAARVEIYEDVICRNYYLNGGDTSVLNGDERCKVEPVQAELATVKGYELFFQILPAVLASVPYGMLADRIGRKLVLILSLLGVVISEIWTLAVCHWSNIFPIRLVWLMGVIQLFGGGTSVCSSIIHVMVTDIAAESERTQIFLFIHAMNVLSGSLAPIASAALMESGHTWTVVISGVMLLAFGTVFIVPMIPETLHLRPLAPSEISRISSSSQSLGPSKASAGIMSRLRSTISSACSGLSLSPQAFLLLALYAPLLFAREAFQMIGLMYVSKKYHIKFWKSNILLSIFQGIQGALIFLIIPAITFVLQNPRFPFQWSPWKRDRWYTIGSMALMAMGHSILGFAPTLLMAIFGLVVMALACGVSSTVLSLLGSAVEPSQVSTIYSMAMMLTVAVAYAMAPIGGALFSKGMEFGWEWTGLPFMVVGAAMTIAFLASFFVKKECPTLGGETHDD